MNLGVLMVEDSEDDALLILRELERNGFAVEYERVETRGGMEASLERREWDCVLCDYSMPRFTAPEALDLLHARGVVDVPFIIVSGAIGEETAVEIMRAGADDYILKGNLRRLVPVINRELQDAKTRAERKRAEEEVKRLYTAIEQVAEAVVITDLNADMVYANPAFERATGYQRTEVIGRNMRILKSGRHDAEFYRTMWNTLKNGEVWTGHLINKRKDGTLFDEEATISPVIDSSGKISNYVAIKRDVTREAMLSMARDYFSSVTAHEMRTPLSSLLLVKTLLEKGDLGDVKALKTMRDAIDTAYTNFERICSATSLLSDLALTWQKGAMQQCFMSPIIIYAVEDAKDRLLKAGRKVAIKENLRHLPAEARIVCNQEMIIRLIREVLSNAVKYTPDGKEVAVKARREAEHVVVEISDEGAGIPQKQWEEVFQPFFSLENPLHHISGEYLYMGGGIGLGLTLAKMIVEFHRGFISLSNRGFGNGTTVTIRLPLAPEGSFARM